MTIANCRCCGSAAEQDIDNYIRCSNEDCDVAGPNNDPYGAKWNALMNGSKPVPEGEVKVRTLYFDQTGNIIIVTEYGEILVREAEYDMSGEVSKFVWREIDLPIIPPAVQVVEGSV